MSLCYQTIHISKIVKTYYPFYTFPVNPGIINNKGSSLLIDFPLSTKSTEIPVSPIFSKFETCFWVGRETVGNSVCKKPQ